MLLSVLLTILAAVTPPACAGSDRHGADGTVEVFFSPGGGCTDAVVREIAGARSEILVQAYSFTSAPIARCARGCPTEGA
jgi:hypothetical protein